MTKLAKHVKLYTKRQKSLIKLDWDLAVAEADTGMDQWCFHTPEKKKLSVSALISLGCTCYVLRGNCYSSGSWRQWSVAQWTFCPDFTRLL